MPAGLMPDNAMVPLPSLSSNPPESMPAAPVTTAEAPVTAGATSYAARLSGLTAKNSPLMQQARTAAKQEANRRGLLNSSMAVQAGEVAAYNAALPIAAQDSAQAHQRQLQTTGIAGDKALQGQRIEAAENLSNIEIGSRERVVDREIAARKALQADEYVARQQLSASEISSRERISDAGNEVQVAVANSSIAADERNRATAALVSMEQVYAQMFSGILSNRDIPADQRTLFTTHIAKLRDSSLGLVEQMYSIDLDWASP